MKKTDDIEGPRIAQPPQTMMTPNFRFEKLSSSTVVEYSRDALLNGSWMPPAACEHPYMGPSKDPN